MPLTRRRLRAGTPRRRPRSFVAAAVLVALIAAAAAVLVLVRPQAQRPHAAAPAPTASATPTAQAIGGGPSLCGLPDGDQEVPVVAPAGTSWDLVGTMAAPSSPATIGPGTDHDGLRSCYAHAPLGALYAATGFLAATTAPGLRLPATSALTAAGRGHDRALDLLRDADPGPTDNGLQVAGFSFLNFDATSCIIDIAMAVQGTAVHLPVTLRWQDGDWKVVLPDTGMPYETIQALPTLTGYVPWAGA